MRIVPQGMAWIDGLSGTPESYNGFFLNTQNLQNFASKTLTKAIVASLIKPVTYLVKTT